MKPQPPLRNAPKKHRILIVEDHPVTQHGFALLLNQAADLMVCGRAGTAGKALVEIESSKPDLVIVDIALPGKDGLELIKDIANFHPKLPTLVLSTLDEAIYAERALRAGAKGYIMKQETVERLLAAVHEVLAGDIHLSEAMRNRLFLNGLSGSAKQGALSVDQLSDRELEVFRLIGEGWGTRKIANNLGLSISTVETHRTHIKEKLGAKRAPELVRQAVEWLHNQNCKF
jgi:DNA-binding NarL/FixJ family response regulator